MVRHFGFELPSRNSRRSFGEEDSFDFLALHFLFFPRIFFFFLLATLPDLFPTFFLLLLYCGRSQE
jgi:hypothetical protein